MSVRRAVPPLRACGRRGATTRQHLFGLDDILVGYLGKDRIVYWGPTGCLTGTYLLHDLPMARYEARKYVEETLNLATEENLVYPE